MSRNVIYRGAPSAPLQRGLDCQQAGDLKRAERVYRKVLQKEPANVDALHLLGLLEAERGNYETGILILRRALQFEPTNGSLYLNCGVMLEQRHCYPQAIACYRRAARLLPDDLYPWFALGVAWSSIGEYPVALEYFEKALAVAPLTAVAMDNLVYLTDIEPSSTQQQRMAMRRRWNDTLGASVLSEQLPHANDPDPDRRLRVGYVSSDFRQHSAWISFSVPMLEYDRARFDVYAYSGSTDSDTATALLRDAGIHWRNIDGHDDASVARMVRDDRIDVLVDLSGFTAGNRLLVFARRPAPVQVSGWGYATGLSLDCMDGAFSDPVLVPPDQRAAQMTEQALYLPCAIAYNPPRDAPPVDAPPVLGRDDGLFTFGCFNQPKKLSTPALKLWARLLQAVPNSRLLLKHTGLELPEQEERIRAHFDEAGIPPDRLYLFGYSRQIEHLASYADVDLHLDPFPAGGGITTLEAAWMGVPTLTLLGDPPSARIGGSIMTHLGLPEYVVESEDAYVERAAEAAADLPHLAEVRAGLRERLGASPICDHALVDGKIVRSGRRYAEAVEAHYRALWTAWCAGRAMAAA